MESEAGRPLPGGVHKQLAVFNLRPIDGLGFIPLTKTGVELFFKLIYLQCALHFRFQQQSENANNSENFASRWKPKPRPVNVIP